MKSAVTREQWYEACREASSLLSPQVPEYYRSRTFSGIIGDIKALSSRKALSLYTRKKGLGLQYAFQYLATGIDRGRGYQACAATALASVLKNFGRLNQLGAKGSVLDAGCAVGVTAGILELEEVVGFDLFADLVRTARLIDTIAGKKNQYLIADMKKDWPFGNNRFDAVVGGLVCHHLKTQGEVAGFFRNASRVLRKDGTLILTLPAGSIATARILQTICEGISSFGFEVDYEETGLLASTDDPDSLFWMFLLTAAKRSESMPSIFVNPSFSFLNIRTPVTREEKAGKARVTAGRDRHAIHSRFALLDMRHLADVAGEDEPLVFEHVSEIAACAAKTEKPPQSPEGGL